MQQVVLIINGSRELKPPISEAIGRLEKLSTLELTRKATSGPRQAIQIARDCANNGADTIIAVGGDGTCNEVVNGIMQSENQNVLFGILPNGTGNDFYRMIGDFSAEKFINAIVNNTHQPVDLCRVSVHSQHTYALNIAGAGFDGHVIRILERQRDKWGMKGKLSYVTAILRAFFTYKKPIVQLDSNQYQYEGKVLLLAVCNGSTFGYGLTIHPDASINDGLLSIAVFKNVSLIDYVRNLSKLKKGKYVEHPEVSYFTTEKLEVKSINGVINGESDGELSVQLKPDDSVSFEVVKNAIQLIIPSLDNV